MQPDEIDQRIVRNPEILLGKPVVRGTRIPVYVIVDLVAAGLSVEQIVDDYPGLTEADVEAAIAYASRHVDATDVPARSA
jgi:uncharacterized protein (DUF433 family)